MAARDEIADAKREARKYKRALAALTAAVAQCVEELDATMREPESRGRGRKIAAVSNALEMANDTARYFGLGVDWRKDVKAKRAEVR